MKIFFCASVYNRLGGIKYFDSIIMTMQNLKKIVKAPIMYTLTAIKY